MKLKSLILLLISILVVGVLLQFSFDVNNYFSLLLIIPGLFIGFVISIIFHEFGHLVCGLLSGYKFVSFRVLFIRVYKKTKINVVFEQSSLLVPGQCLMKPTNRKYILYNLGGLIFTYSLSLVLLYLFYNVNEFLLQFLFGIFLINSLLGVMNSIYSSDGINDICNVIRCRNKIYLEAFLYQLDIFSNVSINDKFKSKYNPVDDVNNSITNLTLYRIKYYKAFHEKNIEQMEYYYLLMKRRVNNISIPLLKIPILILLLNHEFMIKKDINLVNRRCSRILRSDLKYLKKFKNEYSLILFYKNNVCDKEELIEDLFVDFIIDNPVDLFEKLNNKTYQTIYRMYLAYVRNEYVLN